MKNRLKHMSKTTISVLLSLLMIVSTITVGIVATNAAYSDDESLGYNAAYIRSESGGWNNIAITKNPAVVQKMLQYI